jgi:small subunit ribosomal protein S11
MSRLSTEAKRPAADEGNIAMIERMKDLTENPYADKRPPPFHLHVYAHKHNTHITLTRPNREPMLSLSCGSLGFRKSHRGGYDPAYQLSSYVMGKIQERGFLMDIKTLEVVLRGYGPGREAFTKILLGDEGRTIRNLVIQVTDATRLKFGGTRSRRVRRLG